MVHVASETGRLRRVVIQRPGAALSCMLPAHIHPGSEDYLLFDDLVHVPQAQREHDQLAAVLRTTAEVAYVDDMLLHCLGASDARSWLIDEVQKLEDLDGETWRRLREMEPSELAYALVTGVGTTMNPLPNLLFARDLAAVVGDLLVVSNASKAARRRESLLAWTIVRHHPWFAHADVARRRGRYPLTIEGGDVLVISRELALIGASERTSWSMIINLAHDLVRRGYTRVLVAEMPKQRSSMHLDTVFTLVDEDTAVVYPPILEQGREECNIIRLRKSGAELAVEDMEGDLIQCLAEEGHPLNAIPCGGGDPLLARREQWTDGANFVCLAPGVAVGYARNVYTGHALEDQGFTVVDSQRYLSDFVKDFGGDFDRLANSDRRYVVNITGSELCRGRGGPRCLTFPVQRDQPVSARP